MNNKTIVLSSATAALLAVATYAWAGSHSTEEVKTEDAPATTETTEAPARLCIPREEAEAAPAKEAEEDTKTEETAPATTEEAPAESDKPASDENTEVSLPICDEDGNPPKPEATEEETTEEEAPKTE